MRLFVVVQGDEIVVTSETGFRAAYCKRPNFPQLKVRRRTDTDDHELLAQAWQTANAKARELGWITGTPDPPGYPARTTFSREDRAWLL